MLLEQNNIPFGPLAKVGNIVENLYKDGATETPNISHQIPLTPLSTFEPPCSVKVKALNQSVSDPVPEKENMPADNRCTLSSTEDSKISNANASNLPTMRTQCFLASNSIKFDKADQGRSTMVFNQKPNKENQDGTRNAKPIVPQFQPINISSERMKVLSQSIVEVDSNEEETSRTAKTIQKHSMKSRPKVVVKHIVLKRE